ncbi:MAG: hypothetical protein A2Y07_09755 [Planctomycetes bacterium GWF2_50_10]|nr:MAG: hypothetical protein A2Y07_09755 [Planctomycetes bacterium GWF2_50_10]
MIKKIRFTYAVPVACFIFFAVLLGSCSKTFITVGPDMSPIWTDRADIKTVGYSTTGLPIPMYTFGTGSKRILIFAAIHGNEWTSYSVARNLIELLNTDCELYYGTTVAIIPTANPDGLKKNCRTNPAGVDVNRNFPASNWQETDRTDSYSGPAPASESETKAIINAVETFKPDVIISLHSISSPKHGNNFDGPAQHIAQLLASKNGYNVLPSMGYPTPGSFGTWAGIDRKIPTITLELPRQSSPEEAWQQNRDALLAVIQL